jgi:hypothetical protein
MASILREGDPDFGRLLAAIEGGEVVLLGERYDEDGRRLIAYSEDEFIPNDGEEILFEAGFQLGDAYYSSVLRDYQWNFGEKWWREAIQNGVDAGATRVDCRVESQSDGNVLVTCEDDGSGMTQEVLVNAFLMGGGTTKGSGSSTFGGFGKAKELLILPWIRYEIHTRDMIIASANAQRAGARRAPMRQGTRLSVLMPQGKHAKAHEALSYIRNCDLPGVRFTVDGERVAASLGRKQEPLREQRYRVQRDDGSSGEVVLALKYDPKADVSGDNVLVRLNGLFMFEEWVSKRPKGAVLIDLQGAAKDCLVSNRDSIGLQSLARGISSFVQELAMEQETALKSKKNLFEKKYEGSRFRAGNVQRATETILEASGPALPDTRGKILPEVMEAMLEAMAGVFSEDAPRDESLVLAPSPAAARAMLEGIEISGGSDQIEAVAKQMAWEPAFILINEIENYRVKAKYEPERMTAPIRQLVACWAELCRFVLMQLGCSKEFGVGLIFGRLELAECRTTEGGENWLVLNPLPGLCRDEENPADIDLSDDRQLSKLYAIAVHECTHLANRLSSHDSDFAAAITANFATCMGMEREIRKIRTAVRAADKQVAQKIREKKPAAPAKEKKPKQPKIYKLPKNRGDALSVDADGGHILLVRRGYADWELEDDSGHSHYSADPKEVQKWIRTFQILGHLNRFYEPPPESKDAPLEFPELGGESVLVPLDLSPEAPLLVEHKGPVNSDATWGDDWFRFYVGHRPPLTVWVRGSILARTLLERAKAEGDLTSSMVSAFDDAVVVKLTTGTGSYLGSDRSTRLEVIASTDGWIVDYPGRERQLVTDPMRMEQILAQHRLLRGIPESLPRDSRW